MTLVLRGPRVIVAIDLVGREYLLLLFVVDVFGTAVVVVVLLMLLLLLIKPFYKFNANHKIVMTCMRGFTIAIAACGSARALNPLPDDVERCCVASP